MTARTKGVALLLVQMAIVLSIAAKYAWERHERPRVWTRTTQFDPDQLLRGRYLALSLQADACGLSLDKATEPPWYHDDHSIQKRALREWGEWEVVPVSRNGRLAGMLSDRARPEEKMTLRLVKGQPCNRAVFTSNTEFFISERAKSPFPLAKDDELWAEVTVPAKGPPRPIQLAISNKRGFHVLDLH